jgi:hypothetical protein
VFLAAICDALGVSEAWLLCGRGSPYREAGPHGDHITPREAAVAVRASLRELERRMGALESMLEYPRATSRRPAASGFMEARPAMNGNRSYTAATTAEDPATTGPGPVETFRLRQRA